MSNPTATLVTTLRQRGAMVAQLVEAPMDVPTLTEEVSVSRSTVDRALAAFEDWGLIVRDANEVSLTVVGQLVITVYDEFEADVAAMAAKEAEDAPLWSTASERTTALKLVADRLDLLEYAQTPRQKRTLVAHLPYASSTVDWAVRELEVAALIQRTADGYTTTTIGQQIAARYRTLLETLTDLLAARDLLAHLPAECTIPPTLCTKADIERADETTPYRLLAGVRERLDTATRVRAVLPALPNPQLLDVCHQQVVRHGATLELITDPDLADTLTSEFPGPLAEMAAADAGTFTAFTVDAPPFGVVLADTDAGSSVSLLIYSNHQTVEGVFHAGNDAAITWAEDFYAHVQDQATETTSDWVDGAPATGGVTLSAVADPGRVEREAEGFVQLTPEYFARRAPAPPSTAWRVGFDLVDVHAGYVIDREIECDGTRQPLTDALVQDLTVGTDQALLGGPGSGKTTVCRSVACQWYEQGRGAVFYRESGTGTTFDSPTLLSAHLREAADDGHVLVVVEDAVRAEANAIFRVMTEFRGDATVTFLVDARTSEWATPTVFPPDARLDAYRTEEVETVTMPTLDEHDCERLVRHFQNTTAHEGDISIPHLLQGGQSDGDADVPERTSASQPATLLLVLHRLTLHADPFIREEACTPTTLTEDVQQSYETLRAESDLALDVGVLVNLLNAAGLGVRPALVYALAETDEEMSTVRRVLASLEGHLLFSREANDDEPAYRTIHEAWSELFLDTLLDTAGGPAASRRVGRCVSALLALADDAAQRERSARAVEGPALVIERIANAPTDWTNATIDRLFDLGEAHPRLARLYGTSEGLPIEFPIACSSTKTPHCVVRRGCMYRENGNNEQAECDFTHALQLAESTNVDEIAQLQTKARSQLNLGVVAFRRGNLETAMELFTRACAGYREIDNRNGEADCQGNLGMVAGARGDLDRAMAYYERALTIHREIGAAGTKRATSLTNIAKVATLRGDFSRAETYLERSITIKRDSDNKSSVSLALTNLGLIAQKRGDLVQAEDYCNQAIAAAQGTGFRLGKAGGLIGLAEIEIEHGNLAQATEYVQRGLAIYREIGEKRRRALGQCLLGSIARKRGDFNEAKTHLMDALTLCNEGNSRYKEARTLVALGELACDQDCPARARERFVAAAEIYREMGAVRNTVDSLERLGDICETLDDKEAALTHYDAAVALADNTEFLDSQETLTERRAQLVTHLDRESDDSNTNIS